MRFIPPAGLPAEAQMLALLELLSNKEEYKKTFDNLRKMRTDVKSAIKEHDEKLKKIEEWETAYEAKESKIKDIEKSLYDERQIVADEKKAIAAQKKIDQEKLKSDQAETRELKNEAEQNLKDTEVEKEKALKISMMVDKEVEKMEKGRTKLEADIKAFEEKQDRLKLLMAS